MTERLLGKLCDVLPPNPDDDPGWPRSISALAFLFPGLVPWRMRHRAGLDGLVLLRQVFLAFSLSLVLFGVVLPFLDVKGGGAVFPGSASLR